VVGVDQVLDGRLELGDADVATIGKRQFVCAGQTLHMAGGFGWAEIAAVGEYRQDVALHRIGEFWFGAGEWAQVTKALRPGTDVGQHVQEVALGHAFQQRGFQRLGRCRRLSSQPTFDHRLALVVDDDVATGRERSIHPFGSCRQPILQVLDKTGSRGW
jgi:hypothetical protein